jgi:SAM-dependent methyltransferase
MKVLTFRAYIGQKVIQKNMYSKKILRYYSTKDDYTTSSIKKIDLITAKSISDEHNDGGWVVPINIPHKKALPNHYDTSAKNYDYFNAKNSLSMNNLVATLLKSYSPNCKSVLDVTCGTGAQVFDLAQRGYDVIGSDINTKMLEVARDKALKIAPDFHNRFHVADMCSVRLGKFDAVISMFNAVGHITKKDFEHAMVNIRFNLNKNGIYIFDIFNADYLRHGNNITKLTIDWIERRGSDLVIRDIQYSDIDKDGILRSYTLSYEEKVKCSRIFSRKEQTLQVYTAEELAKMLDRCGFNVLEQCGVDREKFSEKETERIFTVAQVKPDYNDLPLGTNSSMEISGDIIDTSSH